MPRPPFFALCADCSARLAEHHLSPGNVLVPTPDLAVGAMRLAKAIAADALALAPAPLREEAQAFMGPADPETQAPLMLVVHAKLCTGCTCRVARDWAEQAPIALTPVGALLVAEVAHELWHQPVGLALMADELVQALASDLRIGQA